MRPVHALVGTDPYLQSQRLSQLLASLGDGVQRVDVDGAKATLADVLDELRSMAMFTASKCVVVRAADEFVSRYRPQLEDYVQAPAPDAVLILRMDSLPANQKIHKLIAKHGSIEPCSPPTARDLPGWIARHAKAAYKLDLEPAAASLIADSLGSELGRIDSELAKLAIQCDGKKLTVRDVAGTVSFQREQAIWEMTNALSAGQVADAVRRWRALLETDASASFRAVTWLGIWLENIRKALELQKQGRSAADIAQTLKIWPRENQQPFFRTVKRMGESGVADAVDLLTEVDRQTKTGVGDAAENVERFILSLPLT